jgi:hypothetical protein
MERTAGAHDKPRAAHPPFIDGVHRGHRSDVPHQDIVALDPRRVAGALAVVVFQSVVADALGGAVAIGALVAVIASTMRLAGDAGTPDGERSNRGKNAVSRLRSES